MGLGVLLLPRENGHALGSDGGMVEKLKSRYL